MVIAFAAIYLGLESQHAEVLCAEPIDVIMRTGLTFSCQRVSTQEVLQNDSNCAREILNTETLNHRHVGTAAIGCPAERVSAVLTYSRTAGLRPRWTADGGCPYTYNSGCAFKYSKALRAICFSPL